MREAAAVVATLNPPCLALLETALHILGLEREAHTLTVYTAQRMLRDAGPSSQDAQVDLLKLGILTLCGTPRFSIRTAERLAKAAKTACDALAHENEGAARIHLFGVERALGLAHLRHNNLRKAEKIFRPLLREYHHISGLGLVPQATFLRDVALQRWCAHDYVEWENLIGQALVLMMEAGFDHQVRVTRGIFGSQVDGVLERLVR